MAKLNKSFICKRDKVDKNINKKNLPLIIKHLQYTKKYKMCKLTLKN